MVVLFEGDSIVPVCSVAGSYPSVRPAAVTSSASMMSAMLPRANHRHAGCAELSIRKSYQQCFCPYCLVRLKEVYFADSEDIIAFGADPGAA